MKIKSKMLLTILTIFGFVILFHSSVNAASANISVSNSNPKPGEKVTVTANVTAGAYNLTLTGNGKSESIYGYTSVNGNKSDSKSITFTAGSSGEKYTFSLSGDMTDINADSAENVSKTTSITVAQNNTSSQNNTTATSNNTSTASNTTNTSKNNSSANSTTNSSSTNTSASNTSTNQEKEPTFETVNQTAIVTEKINFRSSYSTSSSTIEKIPKGATVSIIGSGSNGWSKIKYNDKIGYVKTEYLSDITDAEDATESEENEEENAFGLETLKIKDVTLTPEFSTDIYEYTINATEEIEELDIETAIANTKTAKIEIVGNENFVIGKNVVKINVNDDESENSVVYTITVNIENNNENTIENIDSTILDEEMDRIQKEINIKNWIIRGIIIFVTVVIIIMFILRYKTVTKEQEEEQYNRKDGYVIIDEKFDSSENDREKIAKIEQFDEELENNKEKDVEPPVQPRRMKKTKGKHF